jgi:hypothetical protein
MDLEMFKNQMEDQMEDQIEDQLEDQMKQNYGSIDDSSDGLTHSQLLVEDITQVQNRSYEPISGEDEWRKS